MRCARTGSSLDKGGSGMKRVKGGDNLSRWGAAASPEIHRRVGDDANASMRPWFREPLGRVQPMLDSFAAAEPASHGRKGRPISPLDRSGAAMAFATAFSR